MLFTFFAMTAPYSVLRMVIVMVRDAISEGDIHIDVFYIWVTCGSHYSQTVETRAALLAISEEGNRPSTQWTHVVELFCFPY